LRTPHKNETRVSDKALPSATSRDGTLDNSIWYYEPRLASEHLADDAGDADADALGRIEAICRDLIDHFETFVQPCGFKARVVAHSAAPPWCTRRRSTGSERRSRR